MENLVESSNLRDVAARQFQPQIVGDDAGAIRRILVCSTARRSPRCACRTRSRLAKTFGSAMTLLHVLEPRHERPRAAVDRRARWEIARQEARRYLERIERKATRGVGAGGRRPGSSKAIRPSASRRSRASSAPISPCSGATARAASRRGISAARCSRSWRWRGAPCFIARSSLGGRRRRRAPKRILVPLDGSLRTESVLPTAARIASAHGAELLARPRGRRSRSRRRCCTRRRTSTLARELAARLESSARAIPGRTFATSWRARERRCARSSFATRTSDRPPRARRRRSTSISSCSRRTASTCNSRAILRERHGAPARALDRSRCSSCRTSRGAELHEPTTSTRRSRRRSARATRRRPFDRRGRAARRDRTTAETAALDADARALAETQRDLDARAAMALTRFLEPSPIARALERARSASSPRATPTTPTLQKAAEWFLDNYYLIRRVARQVDEELPRGFVRRPPASSRRAPRRACRASTRWRARSS